MGIEKAIEEGFGIGLGYAVTMKAMDAIGKKRKKKAKKTKPKSKRG